jgi:hypothetical protein
MGEYDLFARPISEGSFTKIAFRVPLKFEPQNLPRKYSSQSKPCSSTKMGKNIGSFTEGIERKRVI